MTGVIVVVLRFDSRVEERLDDAIRNDLGNGQGSTITVLHDVGDDNNRKKEKAKAKERKPILAGRSDEASW